MLARTFKTAAELGLRENEYDALCNVLWMAEDGTIQPEKINMLHFHCGTAHCLAGWAHTIDATAFPEIAHVDGSDQIINQSCMNILRTRLPNPLRDLFGIHETWMMRVNPQKAISALRSYLETGSF